MFPTLPSRDSSAPLAVRRLDWSSDTESLFSPLASIPWSILLDSANAPHEDAHFDIILARPVATLTITDQGAQFELEGKRHTLKSDVCPFMQAQAINRMLYPISKDCELPFAGGAAGAFSYDLGRRVESLPTIAADDIGLPLASIGFYDWALIRDYQSGSWFMVHYLGEAALEATLSELEKLIGKPGHRELFRLSAPFCPQLSRADYEHKFFQIQDYLRSGDCYQINLTQRFSAPFEGSPWLAYLTLRHTNQAPFSAFVSLENGAILSISPERFLKLNQSHIETKPIKGTLARGKTAPEDAANATALAHSAKDRAENLMIVDLLRNDIGRVASPGSVRVPKLFAIESFPAVHHLVSTVTGTLADGLDGFDLLKAAFPGGSITGAPKIRAMEIIEELEPSRRSIYCGAIGYLSQHGRIDTNISIRTLVAKDGQLHCWAGGGIVADSNVSAEYQESFDKVSRILPILEQHQ